MSRHPIQFENLVDWLDGRLDEEKRRAVEEHLASGCPQCQADLAWLQRVITAARSDDMREPPAELVAQAKALYRSRFVQPARERQRAWLFRLPRVALPLAATFVLMLGIALYAMIQAPLLTRTATLSALQGVVEKRGILDEQWHKLALGAQLYEGDQVRVLGGETVLTLFDGSTLRMQPGTELTLSSLRSGLFGVVYQIAMDQQAGSIQYDVTPLRSSRSAFEVQSPTVRVIVRGTSFVITVESAEESRVTVLEGRVRVVGAVDSAVLNESESVVAPSNAPLLYLPTLTPTPTPASVTTEKPSPIPSDTPTVPITATRMPIRTHTAQPTATPKPTRTLEGHPTSTPAPTWTPEKVEFSGTIERFPKGLTGQWLIGGQKVSVTQDTVIVGTPAVGLQAWVQAWRYASRPLVALQIQIEEASPASTVGPTHTPQPTHTGHPTKTVCPTHTPHPGKTEHAIQLPTSTPTRTLLPTYTSIPAGTPCMTGTRHPSGTPEMHSVTFGGTISKFPRMLTGNWVIAGRTVIVTADTQIHGKPRVGHHANVEALQYGNGQLQAVRITISDS